MEILLKVSYATYNYLPHTDRFTSQLYLNSDFLGINKEFQQAVDELGMITQPAMAGAKRLA